MVVIISLCLYAGTATPVYVEHWGPLGAATIVCMTEVRDESRNVFLKYVQLRTFMANE